MVAVEPLDEMRAQLEAAVPGAEALAGSAEALPLPDGAADGITVASAMHWFDLDRALPEFHRVLRPGGGLGSSRRGATSTIRSRPRCRRSSAGYLPERSGFRRLARPARGEPAVRAARDVEARSSSCSTPTAWRSGSGRSATSPGSRTAERAEVLARVRALGEAQPESPFPFRYRTAATVCYAARLANLAN